MLTYSGLTRYADAAKNVRLSQILGRARRQVPVRLLAAGRQSKNIRWFSAAAGLGVDPAPQSGPQPPPHLHGDFTFIGHSRRFPSVDFWLDSGPGLLFLFHLHGFSELATYSAGRRTSDGDAFWSAVLRSWLSQCGEPARPAWHPFPTSGRIIAWCAALSAGGWDPSLQRAMRASLQRQVRVLRRSVEHDIGGNHVLRNGVALAIGDTCLGHGTQRRALRMLKRELALQVLPDGGHEERSPAYQRAILSDLDDLAVVLERADLGRPSWLVEIAASMRAWLCAMAGPDGSLPLLNDAWEGPRIDGRPPSQRSDLAASGYVIARSEADQAIFDVGPPAPPHLPPHAHADVLSFVMWADGRPFISDRGSYAYAGEDRDAFRGTAAHSTIEIDGRDQCDFWGPFRAAHLPNVRRIPLDSPPGAVLVAAEHDGYRRLADPLIHRRMFCWLPGFGLVIVDRLISRASHVASSRLQLAPGVELHGDQIGGMTLGLLGPPHELRTEPGRYSPYLGTASPAQAVLRRWETSPGELTGWSLLRDGATARLTGDGRLRIEKSGQTTLDVAAP